MLDFQSVRDGQTTVANLSANLTKDDLRNLTREMIDKMSELIQNCVDADVTFVPVDPSARDTFATNEADVTLPWTLGHVIVHATASSEESAALAAELARGVPHRGGRSRYEVPWQSVTTIAQCWHRLQESLRMRLASIDMWPDVPDLQNSYQISESRPRFNAMSRFIYGLMHDDNHLGQIAEIVRQAQATKG